MVMKLIILLLIILLTGCIEDVSHSDVQPVSENDMQTVGVQAEVNPDETMDNLSPVGLPEFEEDTIPQIAEDDTTDDCNLLTVKDINEICGVETTKQVLTPQESIGQVCATLFATEDPLRAIKFFYNKGYDPKDYDTLMTDCIDNKGGEKITDYACYKKGAGKSVVIYGKKWRIFLLNTMPMEEHLACTPKQLKILGETVSNRIYG
jgi:hypothetical protein